MMTVVAEAVVLITVTCEHGESEMRLIPPPGLPEEARADVLAQAKALAVEHHRMHEPKCECSPEAPATRDWLN